MCSIDCNRHAQTLLATIGAPRRLDQPCQLETICGRAEKYDRFYICRDPVPGSATYALVQALLLSMLRGFPIRQRGRDRIDSTTAGRTARKRRTRSDHLRAALRQVGYTRSLSRLVAELKAEDTSIDEVIVEVTRRMVMHLLAIPGLLATDVAHYVGYQWLGNLTTFCNDLSERIQRAFVRHSKTSQRRATKCNTLPASAFCSTRRTRTSSISEIATTGVRSRTTPIFSTGHCAPEWPAFFGPQESSWKSLDSPRAVDRRSNTPSSPDTADCTTQRVST
jgi:hypothetical protein